MRKRNHKALLFYGLFLAIVLVTGAWLTANGFDENPFDQLAFMTSFTRNGNEFGEGLDSSTEFTLPGLDSSTTSAAAPEGFTLPDADDTAASGTVAEASAGTSTTDTAVSTTATTATRPQRGEGGGGGSQSLNWSDFGSVLYNVWFMMAVTAVVIPLQYLVRFVLRQTKRRPAAAAAA